MLGAAQGLWSPPYRLVTPRRPRPCRAFPRCPSPRLLARPPPSALASARTTPPASPSLALTDAPPGVALVCCLQIITRSPFSPPHAAVLPTCPHRSASSCHGHQFSLSGFRPLHAYTRPFQAMYVCDLRNKLGCPHPSTLYRTPRDRLFFNPVQPYTRVSNRFVS
ncbi:hypothetical protein PHLGIDRAFT_438670 [Phlebiopsis gigantea 11061_1 CR5-6]|uniref:Uncharacterized protein n=1 Tax=Phlebiopsis gigantea (strain 11061_1 CR5-6) TaxID=745531 RepID=A0A0C3SFA2_PHLG1|nr:hypothetical protein PHLGIDRAFT_438670 [Phlebiopsis gigantea 11061_1 CR5-6]